MEPIVATILSVFGIIGVGYVAAWSGLFSVEVGDTLSDFVYALPLPVLLFRTIATAEIPGGTTPALLWMAHFMDFAIIWVCGTLVIRRVFGRDARAGVVGGMAATFTNAVLLGIPLVVTAYGEAALTPMSLIVAAQLPVLMVVSAILIERALIVDGVNAGEIRVGQLARNVARNVALNPIVIGIVIGLLWRFSGLVLPQAVATVVDRLAEIAGTLALLAMGLGLRKYGIRGNLRAAISMSLLKLVVMPSIALLVVLYLIPLPPIWAKVIVITAALPSGGNVYLVAARFRTGEGLASSTIVLSTMLSVVSLTFWIAIAAAI